MLYLYETRYTVTVSNESEYGSASAVAPQPFDKQYRFGGSDYGLSQHAVEVSTLTDDVHSCILLGDGGLSTVHEHSALLHEDMCVVAVGRYMVALTLPTLDLLWQVAVDSATCFGVYDVPKYDCYISHGECEIAAVTRDGVLLWSNGGKDIFTNGFAIHEDVLEAIDFKNERYIVDLATGQSTLIPPPASFGTRIVQAIRRLTSH